MGKRKGGERRGVLNFEVVLFRFQKSSSLATTSSEGPLVWGGEVPTSLLRLGPGLEA